MSRALSVLLLFALSVFGVVAAPAVEAQMPDPVATFSILGYDPETGEIGGAVQSRVFSVGNGVLSAEAGVGVVATQAIVDVSYGPKGIELLRAGLTPDAIIKAIWDSDPDPNPANWTKEGRQFAVIDAKGNTAVFTGPKATEWAGHLQGKYCTAQGNILAGGDKRGMQSAAILIVGKGQGVWLNNDTVLRLQVDDSPEPIRELRRLVDGWNERRAKGQQRPVK